MNVPPQVAAAVVVACRGKPPMGEEGVRMLFEKIVTPGMAFAACQVDAAALKRF